MTSRCGTRAEDQRAERRSFAAAELRQRPLPLNPTVPGRGGGSRGKGSPEPHPCSLGHLLLGRLDAYEIGNPCPPVINFEQGWVLIRFRLDCEKGGFAICPTAPVGDGSGRDSLAGRVEAALSPGGWILGGAGPEEYYCKAAGGIDCPQDPPEVHRGLGLQG